MKLPWLEIAIKEKGVKEVKGGENPRIIEYHSCTTLKATEDETPWCSAFMNWVMKEAGLPYTKSAAARSWLNWGTALGEPKEGCVVVLKRGAPPSAHVTLWVNGENGVFAGLGGNQGDMVKVSIFKNADVLGYRWPEEVA